MSKFNLEHVFESAKNDSYCLRSEDRYYSKTSEAIGRDVKIVKHLDTGDIKIYNTNVSGEYYQEIPPHHYLLFERYGWLFGSLTVYSENRYMMIKEIESRIREEINNNNNNKVIKRLNKIKDETTKLYVESKSRLNNLL